MERSQRKSGRVLAGLLVSLLVLLTACGGQKAAPAPPSQPQPAPAPAPAAPAPAAPAPAPAPKKLSGQLALAVWGGPVETSWKKVFTEPFTAATGVEVVVQGVPSPQALGISQAGNPQFDVLLVTATEAVQLAAKQAHEPLDPAKFARAGQLFDKLILKDAQGKWLAAPAATVFYALAYQKSSVKAEDLQSWSDLKKPAFKGKLLIPSPFYFATAGLPMLAKAAGGSESNMEPGFQLLAEVMPNVRTASASLADAASMMEKGEATVSLSAFSQYSQLVDRGLPVGFALPKEGGVLSPLYLAIPKGAKNMDNALAFLDFAMQKDRQEAAEDVASYFPVVKDAALIAKLQERTGFKSGTELLDRLYMPNWTIVSEQANAWVKRVEEIAAKNK